MEKNIIANIKDEAERVCEIQRLKAQQIENDYFDAKDKLDEENKKLSQLIEQKYELIEKYSKFKNVNSIMSVLAEITSLFMGKVYYYTKNDEYPTLMPHNMDNNNQMITFYDEYNPNEDSIKFYKYDGDVCSEMFQYTLFESENLEYYDFIKRFIDYVINYKYNVSKENLSFDVLKKIEKNFIWENIDEIRKINEERNRNALLNDDVKKIEQMVKRFTRIER